MKKKRLLWIVLLISAVIIIVGAVLILPAVTNWGFARQVSSEEAALRLGTLEMAEKWMGANQFDGSHKEIIDIYNADTPLPQNYTVQYTDKWCATYVSTVAIQCGLTQILPKECGCQRQIGLFADLGRWEENDDYIPLPGDIIFYSEEGSSDTDNTGWSDHVGIVCGTWGRFIKVIEGNVAGYVAVRYLILGDATIRGYGLPDYASICE